MVDLTVDDGRRTMSATRVKVLAIVDKIIFCAFAAMVFMFAISNAAVEICFGVIYFFLIVRAFLWRLRLRQVKQFFLEPANLSVLIFYATIALSLFVSTDFHKSFHAWFFKWGQGVFLFYFGRIFLKRGQVQVLLKIFAACAVLVGIDGLYQKLHGVDFMMGNQDGSRRVGATFTNANNLAAYLIVPVFIVFSLSLSAKKWWKVIPFVGFTLVLSCFFLTYSRGAWIGFFSGLIVWFIISSRRHKLVLLAVFAACIAFVWRAPFAHQRIVAIFQTGGDAHRFELWRAAWAMFKESPIVGKGIGLFMDQMSAYGTLNNCYAHNCYLQMLAETGVFGLLGFLGMLATVFYQAAVYLKRQYDGLCYGLLTGLFAFLVYGFFDTQFYSLRLVMLFWVLLSFLSVYSSPTRE